jgi:hypothetical protein
VPAFLAQLRERERIDRALRTRAHTHDGLLQVADFGIEVEQRIL